MGDKYTKLAKNTGIFFIGSFGSKILTFLLVRFYTEYLSTGEFGVVDLFNTTASLAFPLVTLCMTEAVLRFSIGDIDSRSKIFSSGMFVTLLGNLLFAFSALALCHIDIFRNNLAWLYLLTISNSLVAVSSHFARGMGQSKLFAISGIVHTFFQIGFNILFLAVFTWGIRGYLVAAVMANLVTFLYVFLYGRLNRYIIWEIDFHYLGSMLTYALPLIPNSVFWWVMQSSNRFIITYSISEEANGLYAVANKIPSLIVIVSSIFFLAWQIASVEEAKSKDKDRFYTRVFESLAALLIVMTSFIMVLLQPLYHVLAEESFYPGWTTVPFLLCATVFSCYASFIGTNYMAMKKTMGIFLTTMTGAVINVVLTIALIPVWGVKGAAVAMMVAFFVTWVARIHGTREFVRISYSFMFFWMPSLLILIQAVIISIGVHSAWVQLAFLLLIISLYTFNGTVKGLFIFLCSKLFQKLKLR